MPLFKPLIFIFLIQFIGFLHLTAQVANDSAYLNENVSKKSFDESHWKSLKKELDYNEKEPEYKEQQKSYSLPFSIKSIYVKSFLFILVAAVLIYILIKLFSNPLLSNSKIPQTDYTIDTIEEDIHEADLESFLKGAIESKNYKQMIRIYYLIIIRELSNKKIITWKKDKTNHQYLQEMTLSDDFKIFKELTHYFEFIWYSKKLFSEQQYLMVSEQFNKYIEKLNTIR